MIKSMTGYGKGETVSEHGRCVVELRSVNNRFAELSVKMPRSFLPFEAELRKLVAVKLKRGKADLFVQWEPAAVTAAITPVNHAVAKGYHQAFVELAHELNISATVSLELILAQKNVLQESVTAEQPDLLPQLLEATAAAVDAMDLMRKQEGGNLLADIVMRRRLLARLADEIKVIAPQIVDDYRNRLRQRLERLLDGAEPDPQRLAQEVAILADKADVTEELVRLESHLTQLDATVLLDEPVGRKLDFLMQELNREVNTIGSKANDAAVTSIVVQMKAELEKMREQVQNIE